MQTIHYVIAAGVGLMAILAYVFKAGQWAQERVSRDEKLSKLDERFEDHLKDAEKWKRELHDKYSELVNKVRINDERITRVENDRRIVIFPRDKRRRDEFDGGDSEG